MKDGDHKIGESFWQPESVSCFVCVLNRRFRPSQRVLGNLIDALANERLKLGHAKHTFANFKG
jgi:hypothetical protein